MKMYSKTHSQHHSDRRHYTGYLLKRGASKAYYEDLLKNSKLTIECFSAMPDIYLSASLKYYRQKSQDKEIRAWRERQLAETESTMKLALRNTELFASRHWSRGQGRWSWHGLTRDAADTDHPGTTLRGMLHIQSQEGCHGCRAASQRMQMN